MGVKDVGSGQIEGNYWLEVFVKSTVLYPVPKLRYLNFSIFLWALVFFVFFGGFGGFEEEIWVEIWVFVVFLGAKHVGTGQNEENYRLEFLGKPPDLSSAKAEKFDLFYFCGFGEWGRFLGGI